MSSSISRDSSDLVFDAVPDQPRENIIENINEDEIANATDQVEDTSISSEATRQPVDHLDLEPPSRSQQTDEEKPVINSAPAKQKNTDSRKKKSKKSSSSAKQGDTIINIIKSTNVHVGSTMVFQSNGLNPHAYPSSNTPKATKEIKKLLESTQVVSVDHIESVSPHVGSNWRDVGRQLKYTDGQLEQFYEDNERMGLKEVVYQMLLDWKRANASKATVGMLANALWMSHQRDAVDILTKKPGKT